MRRHITSFVLAGLLLTVGPHAHGLSNRGFELRVVAGGASRPELRHRGATYVEALEGREYTLRLHNPLGRRVAVALAVDGLNTIDARHTAPSSAAKWVIEPYGTVEITGWQVSPGEARRFYFTTERDSYGAWLGETENLGVIEAVFFRERERPAPITRWLPWPHKDGDSPDAAARTPHAREQASAEKGAPGVEGDSAATGIGDLVDHRVERVHLELEHEPAARLRIRYEFRPELVRMGVLPSDPVRPWERRERAEGFCPDPY